MHSSPTEKELGKHTGKDLNNMVYINHSITVKAEISQITSINKN